MTNDVLGGKGVYTVTKSHSMHQGMLGTWVI